MLSYSGGKPGLQPLIGNQPREVFYANRDHAQFAAGPITIDGTLSSNPSNAPYTFYLFAGTLMGLVTATGKFANSVLGLTAGAVASAATSITTDVNTAAELVRRFGTSGSFKLTGPPTAGGTVATQTVTYSAVNLSTGVITCSALGAAAVTKSLIQPADGSQTILTLICDVDGVKVADGTNVNRVDAYDPQLLLGGGTINSGMIVNYPADVSLQAYVKAAIKAFCANGVTFSDDL